ncbi:MAG: 2-oxoglutarate/2-oxoacid ferredoxin oxidoreductase subunit alpha [Acidimicrobiia bacterium]|jgi:2-oxoglutarate ferredoxin oxidoreductase subunit alpha|nr:2-oxoglutarate/2-oxoacid ferredoxin oxidoreductase subunit alpha [Acidimicrobiia bacterium]
MTETPHWGSKSVTDVQTRPGASGDAEPLDHVVIRFAGDSGDGMQLTGERFTSASAVLGNDLATLPDFPAEIRAPAGTLFGVSAFQVQISDHDVTTPGDAPSVLVAMNPAALRNELDKLEMGGTVILNSDAFVERELAKAGYDSDPREGNDLKAYRVIEVPMTSLTKEAVKAAGVKPRDAERSKNLFALGLISWMYSRPLEPTLDYLKSRFGKNPQVLEANTLAFRAGHAYGETAELTGSRYEIKAAEQAPGVYTSVNGNTAMAWGMVAAGVLSKLPVFLASYPITPASDILHELSKHKSFGVRTLQAEDEIAGASSALGAAYGGALAFTTTSGPGVALKGETMGLAVSLELPLVVIDIQRGGPSTGLPTKTEAADLMMAMYGRHAEAPLPIVASYCPSHCFDVAIEASRIALKYRTPVIVLSDGYLANGSEPWLLPDVSTLPDISTQFAAEPNHINDETGQPEHWPYVRDPDTLARQWALPGTPGLMHRIGGIEKEDGSGNISYTPENHGHMVATRAAKIAGIAQDIPLAEVTGDIDDAELLVLGWGSTWGSIVTAVDRVRARGHRVAHCHIVHLNPFPSNLGEVLGRYPKVLVPEMNTGQLCKLVRAEYLVDAQSLSKVQGVPFTAAEVEQGIMNALGGY